MIARSLVNSDGEKISFSGNLIWCGKQTIINNVVWNFKNEYHSHVQDDRTYQNLEHEVHHNTSKEIKQTERAVEKD